MAWSLYCLLSSEEGLYRLFVSSRRRMRRDTDMLHEEAPVMGADGNIFIITIEIM